MFLVRFIPRYSMGFGIVINDFIFNFIFCLCYQMLEVNAAAQGCQGPVSCFLSLHRPLRLRVTS